MTWLSKLVCNVFIVHVNFSQTGNHPSDSKPTRNPLHLTCLLASGVEAAAGVFTTTHNAFPFGRERMLRKETVSPSDYGL
jgi:hypothetical protein